MSAMLDLIATLISESEQLLTLANDEQWDAFVKLEQQRQNHLDRLDLRDVNLSQEEHATIQQQMQALIALNTQIETQCRQQRDTIAAELKKINQSHKIKKAYS